MKEANFLLLNLLSFVYASRYWIKCLFTSIRRLCKKILRKSFAVKWVLKGIPSQNSMNNKKTPNKGQCHIKFV